MNIYQKNKQKAINEAIDWQNTFDNYLFSYAELTEIQARFEKNGKKYGLLKEFRENGII